MNHQRAGIQQVGDWRKAKAIVFGSSRKQHRHFIAGTINKETLMRGTTKLARLMGSSRNLKSCYNPTRRALAVGWWEVLPSANFPVGTSMIRHGPADLWMLENCSAALYFSLTSRVRIVTVPLLNRNIFPTVDESVQGPWTASHLCRTERTVKVVPTGNSCWRQKRLSREDFICSIYSCIYNFIKIFSTANLNLLQIQHTLFVLHGIKYF